MTELFSPKNILLVENYVFDNGEKKDKLLIVLDNLQEELCILQVLTTSQDKFIPDNKIKHGCVNDNLSNLSFFVFEKDIEVGFCNPNTEKNFSFKKNTFVIFQNNISKKNTLDFLQNQNEIQHLATLSDEIYKSLISCISKSLFLKRNLKPFIQDIIQKNNFDI